MPGPEHRPGVDSAAPQSQHSRERSSHRSDILVRLEQAVGEIQDSDSFRRYLDAQARFHRYSFGNVALILAQRPDATQVAGYNAWLKLHRYVRRGEKGIKIIVPMHRKPDEEDPDQEPQLFFGTGTVFDISQTEGEPLPQVEVPVLAGEQGRELYGHLSALAEREGISVESSSEGLDENVMGVYHPGKKQIVVRPAAPLQMVKTLAHELGHHFSGIDASTAENETIAEAVAYVVCSHFGLDTGERSFPYVALWSKEPVVLKKVLGIVQGVSARIIDGVECGGDFHPQL